ncbi:hypothetical protein KC19_12G170600 [Ceratodon purpureus]|uniref:Uncharacterized protein n=1 Tax=Ceratodon purpureus TaxID=3225 RepID=A0A8T0GBS7_CERPU|nr:hypothetical protein KC19_12G170600 [Ceratodon purpureus]
MTSTSSYKRMLIQTVICLILSSLFVSEVHGAKAIYAFGDSYIDAGNANASNDPLSWTKPYGMTWPGYPSGRASNGQTQLDYVAEKFNLPSPIAFQQLKNTTNLTQGVNFAVGGAGVTYCWGHPTLHTQVDQFEAFIKSANISKSHLKESVAFINIGLNDHTTYHGELQGIPAWIDIIVDGITYNIWRINNLGIKNIMVTNLPPLDCGPWATYINNFTSCTKNETLIMENIQHNEILAKAIQTLQHNTPDMHVILLNQTQAMNYLLSNKSSGFVNTTVPCCHGWGELGYWQCGVNNENGDPIYTLCSNPSETFWWDQGHPSDAGAKALIELYWSMIGFTRFGRNIESWIRRYSI